MYVKPNKAGKNMWLRARIANQNLKQNVQTQDADGMQAFFCVTYDTARGNISTPILLIGSSVPPAPTLFDYVRTEIQPSKRYISFFFAKLTIKLHITGIWEIYSTCVKVPHQPYTAPSNV